jgi:predicted enzyme related to lactoylglutathione lyase
VVGQRSAAPLLSWPLLAFAFLLSGTAAPPASAGPPLLPALVAPASQEHHAGKVVLVELVTPDLAVAERFYAGMFGWTYRELQSGTTAYAEASLDGHPVAGLLHRRLPAGAQRQSAWLTFLAVADVDAARKSAVERGAKVLMEPRDVPDRGREAVLADPQGAVFALLSSTSGDPPDELPGIGEWIWSALITADPDAGAAFYQALCGYEVFESPPEEAAPHFLLASEGLARASANTLPSKKPGVRPHWLGFVRVEDAVASAAQAVLLGGRVLVEPRPDRHGGKVAVVADPLGAPFGLLEWPVENRGVAP